MSRPIAGRGRGRGGPSLIAAAQAQGRTASPSVAPSAPAPAAQNPAGSAPQRIHISDSIPPSTGGSSVRPALGSSVPMAPTRSATAGSEGSASVSSRSTPFAVDGGVGGGAGSTAGVPRMKFKPKVPIRRVKQEVDVKPEITPTAPTRGAFRGRGRGGASRGRGAAVVSTSIAAGIFGGPRPVASSSGTRRFAPAPTARHIDHDDVEVYSDHSDHEAGMGRPIDIDLVSTMSESAPTSLYRDRRLNTGKAKAKGEQEKDKDKDAKVKKDRKGKTKAQGSEHTSTIGSGSGTPMDLDPNMPRVKDEPISPEKRPQMQLREDDAMLSDDEDQDRDERGRRVRSFAQTGGIDEPDDDDVNEAQKVDLSDSESEEEEEMMEGDFVQADGYDDPEKKLFIFQFPHIFPKFVTPTIDLTPSTPATTSDTKPAAVAEDGAKAQDVKPDIKPTAAQLRANAKKAAAEKEVPPEGRVGTLVVMKSGKVKMVMGNDIVMNVIPGLPATFIQHLVHLDSKTKSAMVLGEVHKSYVVTPDIDRLLAELYVSGGKTPGEQEAEQRRRAARDNFGRGLVKMELD